MGLNTRNEFACGRNGGSASRSMYIFRVSINPANLSFFVVLRSICASKSFFLYFCSSFLLLHFCMYVPFMYTSYGCLFVHRKEPQNTSYQASPCSEGQTCYLQARAGEGRIQTADFSSC